MIKIRSLLLISFLILGCNANPAPFPFPQPAPNPPTGSIAAQLLAAHNAQRKAHGLGSLTLDSRLVADAEAHARWMAQHNQMTHLGADGDPWVRIRRTGYRYSNAGENVAGGQNSVAQVVGDWMTSPGHRANILGAYAQMGGAVATPPGGRSYWTCVFASPSGGAQANRDVRMTSGISIDHPSEGR